MKDIPLRTEKTVKRLAKLIPHAKDEYARTAIVAGMLVALLHDAMVLSYRKKAKNKREKAKNKRKKPSK